MSTPILIAARNEQEEIGRTLHALSKQNESVEPIVIVNGSNDLTADIARHAGAKVLESAEGKMPALQEGVRYLGKRALEPLLMLDADSRPLSKNWSARMRSVVSNVSKDSPAVAWGPYVFSREINIALGALFTITSMQVSWTDRHRDNPRTVRGGNTAISIRNDDGLEKLLSLDNYWPREDVAIFDTLKNCGANHKVSFHPEAWVLTSGIRITDTLKQFIKSRGHSSFSYDTLYAAEAPDGSKPYFSDQQER